MRTGKESITGNSVTEESDGSRGKGEEDKVREYEGRLRRAYKRGRMRKGKSNGRGGLESASRKERW